MRRNYAIDLPAHIWDIFDSYCDVLKEQCLTDARGREFQSIVIASCVKYMALHTQHLCTSGTASLLIKRLALGVRAKTRVSNILKNLVVRASDDKPKYEPFVYRPDAKSPLL